MRKVAMFLFLAGFFAAAFVTVRRIDHPTDPWKTIEWPWYLAAFGMGAIGVILLRVSSRQAATVAHKIESELQAAGRSLDSLVAKISDMNNRRHEIGVYDVHLMIDEILVEDLGAFVDVRESIAQRFGLQSYADLMSRFALSERNINRAWCASADGYIDEVWNCMDIAEEEMTAAQELLQDYQSAA